MIAGIDVPVVGQENDPFLIRGDVGKPVVESVVRHLGLVSAAGRHAPDLHAAAAHGIKVDGTAVGGELRPVIHALRKGQPSFSAACGGDFVDVDVAETVTGEKEEFAVRGPTVQIGRSGMGNFLGRAALGGQGVDNRLAVMFIGMMADAEHASVKGQHVIVVVAGGKGRIQLGGGVGR